MFKVSVGLNKGLYGDARGLHKGDSKPLNGLNPSRRRRIYTLRAQVDHTKCGTTNSTNFPLLVNINNKLICIKQNGGYVSSTSGYDILFYSDAACTKLMTWEIDYYNGTTGVGIFWVTIPTLSITIDTVFYIRMGYPGISTFQGGTSGLVWSNAGSYIGVYHLGDGATLSGTDATGVNNLATVSGATATTGLIGGGASIPDANGYLWNSGGSTINTSNATISCLINVSAFTTDATPNRARILGFDQGQFGSTDDKELYIDKNGAAFFYVYDGAVKFTGTPSANLSLNTWYYLSGVIDGTNAKVYLNGVEIGTIAASGSYTGYTSANLLIAGKAGGGGRQSNSAYVLDDVSYSSTARSVSWILAEANNRLTPGNIGTPGFLTFFKENR